MIAWTRKGQGLLGMGAAGWSYANQQLQRELEALGVLGDDAPVAVSFCVAGNYRPVEGVRNVLFTMWESTWQCHDEILPVIRDARPDAVIVPCDWNRDMLAPQVDCPVRTVPLGYDPAAISYQRRRWRRNSGVRFRWLFVGAPNYRKYSLSTALHAYLHTRRDLLRRRGMDFEFYFKFSGEGRNEHTDKALDEMRTAGMLVEEREPGLFCGVGTDDDCIIDNRFLPREEILALMHSAHGGLCLHTGEGFGLNALEMMASGLPVLVTDYSGTTQFANARNAATIPARPCKIMVAAPGGPIEQQAVLPRLSDVGAQALAVMSDYYSAVERAKCAYRDVRSLTWRNSAAALCTTLAELGMITPLSDLRASA